MGSSRVQSLDATTQDFPPNIIVLQASSRPHQDPSGPQVPGVFCLEFLFVRDQAAGSSCFVKSSQSLSKHSALSLVLSMFCFPMSSLLFLSLLSIPVLLAAGSGRMVLRTVVRPGAIPGLGGEFWFQLGQPAETFLKPSKTH
ncbi:hypothetical protein A0H81_13195 [Grifola frondosa]|uniref:Uncharacterized protein n=1 Tax=Grifola frondosa TaxID=5627 RepID=A0A1C7LQ76_GRIFR|nr:hypothetical protein A0H81_13195 [Grifola frondosa]